VLTRWSSALLAGAVLAAAGCRGGVATVVPTHVDHGGTLDAPLYGAVDPTLAHAVHGALVQLDQASGRVVPDLASGWSHDPGDRRWTFRLRNGTDGRLFAGAIRRLPGVAVVTLGAGALTVRLSGSTVDFPERLVAVLAGPGPFRIARRAPREIDLRPNPAYPGRPVSLAGVHLHVYPADGQPQAFADFRAARLDYADVPPGQIDLARGDPALAAGIVTQPRLELIALAVSARLDPNLQRAIALATPAPAVVAQVGDGSLVTADGVVPLGLPARPAQAPSPSPGYDPARARALAGLAAPLRVAYPSDPFHRRIAAVLLGGFRAAGLRFRPEPDRSAGDVVLVDVSCPAPSVPSCREALRARVAGATVVPVAFVQTVWAVSDRVTRFAVDIQGVPLPALMATDG
jgi:Bacterial extracellular solute-binding proteins, family 5 Middle